MTALREWAALLCTAAMLCTALQLLLPDRGATPMMRVLLSLFFCCCLFGPLQSLVSTDWTSILPSVSVESGEESLRRSYYATVQQQADRALRQAVDTLLADTDYHVEKISARWTESDDGSIYLSGADAYLSAEQTAHTQEIARLLNSRLGLSVTVHPQLER